MCGVAAVFDRQGGRVDVSALKKMTWAIRHRGPNDEGHILFNTATEAKSALDPSRPEGRAAHWDLGLGNRRLSILDLSPAAHQPMGSADGKIWLTYNGEIYNYVELRDELRARGHVFSTTSDTEVVLRAYEEYGADCVQRFNGMWAFILWDGNAQVLFCSRDRFGEKPLYFFSSESVVVLASEIKAVLEYPGVTKAPNYSTVFDYAATGYGFTDTSDQTFFEGIRQLPAGHSMFVSRSDIKVRRYWQLAETRSPRAARDEEDIEQFGSLFRESVKLRLRSDVPIGFCLSGGLDSSSAVCMAATMLDNVTTFSSCAEDARFDEREFMEPVVEKTGATAHFLFPDPGRLFDLLPKMIAHQDEPWTSMTMLAHWMLMERARSSGVTVLLNGHGGDETTAGYYPHLTSFQTDLLKQLRLVAFVRELRAARAVHGVSVASSLGRVGRLLASRPLGAVRDGLGLRRRHFPRLDPDFAKRHETVARPSRSRSSSYLTNELMAGAEVSPIPAWLRYEDRNSMAFSVETRQPFLDHRLVEFLFSIPSDLKIRAGVNKYILRRALQSELPEAVSSRISKLGFTTSAQVWFQEELRDPIGELLASRSFKDRGVFDVRQIQQDFKAHCEGRANKTFAIWSCVNLELWFQHFFD